jgi:hypothetical protein
MLWKRYHTYHPIEELALGEEKYSADMLIGLPELS